MTLFGFQSLYIQQPELEKSASGELSTHSPPSNFG
jgi:hypothetical protein